ncbi:hypothetical protein C8F00_1964 [Xanthomonas vasicola]
MCSVEPALRVSVNNGVQPPMMLTRIHSRFDWDLSAHDLSLQHAFAIPDSRFPLTSARTL